MTDAVYEKTFQVRSYEVDLTGRVRATALLNYLQEAAGDHSRLLGVSVRDLIPRGLTWVLARTHLQIVGSVHSREEVRVSTWPANREGRFSCREFELTAADGRPVALATCSFALLDLASRRPVVIDRHLPPYPLILRRAIPDDFPSLPRLAAAEREFDFRVGMADLDINRHANNVAYAAWGLETVPAEVGEGYVLTDLEIAYRAEVFYGETVRARCGAQSGGDETVFVHQLVRGEDGAELTRLVSRWRRGADTASHAGHPLP